MPQTTIVQEEPSISKQTKLNAHSKQILFNEEISAQIVVRLQQNELLPINSDYMQFQENSNIRTSSHTSISQGKNLRSKSDTIGKQNRQIPDIKCSHTPLNQSHHQQQQPKDLSNLILLINGLNRIDPAKFIKRFITNFCQSHHMNAPTNLISFKQRIIDIIAQNPHLTSLQDSLQQNPFTKEKQNLHRDIVVIIMKIVDSLRLTAIPRLSISDICFNVLTQRYELDARRVLEKLNCQDYNILVNQLSDQKKQSNLKKQVSGILCFPLQRSMLNKLVARVKTTHNNQTRKISVNPSWLLEKIDIIQDDILSMAEQKSKTESEEQRMYRNCQIISQSNQNIKYLLDQKVFISPYKSDFQSKDYKKVFNKMRVSQVEKQQIFQSIYAEEHQSLCQNSKSIENQLDNQQSYKTLISQADEFLGSLNNQMNFKKYQKSKSIMELLLEYVESKSITDKKAYISALFSVKQLQILINQKQPQNTSKKLQRFKQFIRSCILRRYLLQNNKQVQQAKDQIFSYKNHLQNNKSKVQESNLSFQCNIFDPQTNNLIQNEKKTQAQKIKIKRTQNDLEIEQINQQKKQKLFIENLQTTQTKQILLLRIINNLQAVGKLQLENQQLLKRLILCQQKIQSQQKSNQEFENVNIHSNLCNQMKENNKNLDIFCDQRNKFIEAVVIVNLIELYKQADLEINEALAQIKSKQNELMKMKKGQEQRQIIKVLQTIYFQNEKVLPNQILQNVVTQSSKANKQPKQTIENNSDHQQQSSQNSFTHLNEFSSQEQQKISHKSAQKLSQTNQQKSQLQGQTQKQQQQINLQQDQRQLTNLNQSIHSIYSCGQEETQNKNKIPDRNKIEREKKNNCEESFFSEFNQNQSATQSNDSFANLNHSTEKNGQKCGEKEIGASQVENNVTHFECYAQKKQFKQKESKFLKKEQVSIENSVMNKGFIKNESFFVVDEASLELAQCLSEQQKSYYMRLWQQKLPSKSQNSQNFLNIPANKINLDQPITKQKLANLQKAIDLSNNNFLLKQQYVSTLDPSSNTYKHFSNIPSEQFNLKDLHQFYHPYSKQHIINQVKYQTHYSQFVQEGVYELSESKNKSLDLCFNVVRFCLINLVTHYRKLSLLKIEQEVKQTLYPSQYQWAYLDQKKTNAKWLNCEDKLSKAMMLSYQKIQQYKNRIQRQPDSPNVKKTIQLQRQKSELVQLINQLNSKNNQNQRKESQDSKDRIKNNIQLMTKIYDWIIILLSEEYLNKAHLEKCFKKICKKYKVTGFKYQEVFGNSNFKQNIQKNQTYRRVIQEFLIYVIQMTKIWHIISNLPHYSYFTEKQNIRRKSMTQKKLPAPKKVEEILKTLDIFYIYKGQRLNTEYLDKKMNEQPDKFMKTIRFYLNLAEIINPFYEDNQLRMKQLFFATNQNQKNFMKKYQKSENKFIEQQTREIHKQKMSIFQKDEYKSTFNKIFQNLYQPKTDKKKAFSLERAFLSQVKQVLSYLKSTSDKI